MKQLLDILRNRSVQTQEFRRAAHALCCCLLKKAGALLRRRGLAPKDMVVVVILRSALAFLDPALELFPGAPVGVLGFKRDERTLRPRFYYENLPPLSKKSAVLLLDPMLATGGSAEAAVKRLIQRGAYMSKIYFVGVIAAPEGLKRLATLIPKKNIILAAVDQKLDHDGMIVPGLGDFGDRYFGHAGQAIVCE